MSTENMQKEFNAAINFAIDKAGFGGIEFLEMWREGAWDEISSEFPEFKGPIPGASKESL